MSIYQVNQKKKKKIDMISLELTIETAKSNCFNFVLTLFQLCFVFNQCLHYD